MQCRVVSYIFWNDETFCCGVSRMRWIILIELDSAALKLYRTSGCCEWWMVCWLLQSCRISGIEWWLEQVQQLAILWNSQNIQLNIIQIRNSFRNTSISAYQCPLKSFWVVFVLHFHFDVICRLALLITYANVLLVLTSNCMCYLVLNILYSAVVIRISKTQPPSCDRMLQ